MTGLDLVPKCIEVCKKKYADKQGNFDFICADFYTFEYPKGGYDLVYDYTWVHDHCCICARFIYLPSSDAVVYVKFPVRYASWDASAVECSHGWNCEAWRYAYCPDVPYWRKGRWPSVPGNAWIVRILQWHSDSFPRTLIFWFRYDELLGENFDRVFIEDAKGHKSRLGREKMSVWKRKLQ